MTNVTFIHGQVYKEPMEESAAASLDGMHVCEHICMYTSSKVEMNLSSSVILADRHAPRRDYYATFFLYVRLLTGHAVA
jgi:hypothetical protein